MNLQKIMGYYFLIFYFFAQPIFSQCSVVHNVGKLVVKSSHVDHFGGFTLDHVDCRTNKRIFFYGAEYPKNSGITSLARAQIYIGGVVDNDTLLINTNDRTYEYWTTYRSILDPTSDAFEGAVSEQDDLARADFFSEFKVQVSKSSYAWSYGYADDFVLYDIEIKSNEKKNYQRCVYWIANLFYDIFQHKKQPKQIR